MYKIIKMNAEQTTSKTSEKTIFTQEEQSLLFELVKKNNCLYDGSRSKQSQRLEIWNDISAELCKTGTPLS